MCRAPEPKLVEKSLKDSVPASSGIGDFSKHILVVINLSKKDPRRKRNLFPRL